ncbi:ribonuclease domain-containing protein [Kaistella jeonii]|uniref:Ribonuclease n=1 Tax=Kaistella jeonii TaxID=266749 RepID=A0A0C1F4X3_9FLAO|nr:ribonuclease domain-containing protein [Kaistella jeonii]KIA88232.1 ribonuclease N [Kaistella jeonii]SFC26445.1 ribonuclease [Kaistella jeonii]VEI95697.1 Ribonuclease precursor [Kaistella jeonii]
MNKQNIKLGLFFIIGLLTAFLVMYFFQNYQLEKKNDATSNTEVTSNNKDGNGNSADVNASPSKNTESIDELTNEKKVINYVKATRRLPDYYVTKSEAKKSGWVPSKGNLCDVLPGKAIGGDRFSNREKNLPGNEQYYEADVNYNCGNRNADRIVFTVNGDIFLTKDHYKSFQKQ